MVTSVFLVEGLRSNLPSVTGTVTILVFSVHRTATSPPLISVKFPPLPGAF